MNSLDTRKQLLVAESELNRAQLVSQIAVLTAGVRAHACHFKSVGSIVSSTAVLVAGMVAFQRGKTADSQGKTSWLQTIMKGAGLLSTLWLAFRSKRSEEKEQ
jgi:hypothetical protein